MRMCRSLFTLLFGILFFCLAKAEISDRFPTPPDSPIRLFYIQRSSNANAVIYDANFLANRTLNPNNPVHTYWIRYAEKGAKEELTIIQRSLAYGLYMDPIKGDPTSFEGYFLAYRKRKFVVKLDPKGQPIALFPINGKLQILKRVYVSVDDSKFITHVNYIDLYGKDLSNTKDVYERFVP